MERQAAFHLHRAKGLPGAVMTRVLSSAGCNIALYYYSGFCYLQLRRYTDAALAFNSVLTYIARCAALH